MFIHDQPGFAKLSQVDLAADRGGQRAGVEDRGLDAELETSRDYSYADANEVKATERARTLLGDIKVPTIYFASKIHGRYVLVQERIPGVGLNIAWQYISTEQKQNFKDQAREILRKLSKAEPPDSSTTRSYIVEDPDPKTHRGIQELEYNFIFSEDKTL